MALAHVEFFSETLGLYTQMEVILPHVTSKKRSLPGIRADGSYPVLYLLHGMGDNQSSWLRRTCIERYVQDLGIAVVMPTAYLGWYTDTAYGFKCWTFLSQELPDVCRQFFPRISTKREDTFAAGLSMGGYGALKCGLMQSERFGAVASLSGALDIARRVAFDKGTDKDEQRFWHNIFGQPDTIQGGKDDLFAAAEQLATTNKPRPAIYLWCGTEDFLYEHNMVMRDHLQKLGYNLTYEESSGGHEWSCWDEKIRRVLQWLTAPGGAL